MKTYSKIVMNGEKCYREFHEDTGFYGQTTLTEQELTEQLLLEITKEIIEIDNGEVDKAISTIPDQNQREIVQRYLEYLERIAESF